MSATPHLYREWCLWMAKQRAHRGDEADEAQARSFEADAERTPGEQLVTWPDGIDRAAAEKIARTEFPSMPVEGATNGFLLGVVIEVQKRDGATRADSAAVARFDSARFDETSVVILPNDRVQARARVHHSGLEGSAADAAIEQLARRAAWFRAADAHVARAVRARTDSADSAAAVEPIDEDLRKARSELAHKRPLEGSKASTDVFAANDLEAAIGARARRLAAERTEKEIERNARAALPLPPDEPKLPMPSLSKSFGEWTK